MSEQEKLISGLSPLSDAEIEEGPGNLERSLDASDQKREAGVQEAVDPVYPPTGLGLVSKPIPGFPESSGLWSPTSYMTVQQATPEKPIYMHRTSSTTRAKSWAPD
jgi:hypothetical protein